MPELNNNYILAAAQAPSVPLNDLSQVYLNAQKFQGNQNELNAQAAQAQQSQTVNSAFRGATGADGSVDQGKLQAALAAGGAGSLIPGYQKSAATVAQAQATTAQAKATTDKTSQETIYNGLKMVNGSIAALAANPNTTETDVMGEMGRLVNAGAFNVQAQHAGVTPDAYARNLVSTMPVGNPQGLHTWLIENGLRSADAAKQLETILPKYDKEDRGGTINEGTIDQITGKRTAGTDVQKTVTPDAAMQDATTRRGQNMQSQTAHDQIEANKPDDVPDEQVESVAQMIANHHMPPLTAYAMTRPGGMKVMSRVAQINPDYNGQDYTTQQAADKNFAQGPLGNKTRSFNVGIAHLDTLDKLVDNMNNTSSPQWNSVANAWTTMTGEAAPMNMQAAKQIVGKEVTAAIVANGGGEKERQDMESTLANANSPQQLKGVIHTYKQMMGGQLGGLKQQYESGTGRKDFETRWLSPTARDVYHGLGAGAAAPGGASSPSAWGGSGAGSSAPAAGQGGRPSLSSFYVSGND